MSQTYFLPTLLPLTVQQDYRGVELMWDDTYEPIAETYHVYRNTVNVFPAGVNAAIINATQYIDLPTASGVYYYWVAYITLNQDHVVFSNSVAITVDRDRVAFDTAINLPAFQLIDLPLTPIVGDVCMYDDGTDIRPIFYDGSGNWRFFSDNSIVS